MGSFYFRIRDRCVFGLTDYLEINVNNRMSGSSRSLCTHRFNLAPTFSEMDDHINKDAEKHLELEQIVFRLWKKYESLGDFERRQKMVEEIEKLDISPELRERLLIDYGL